MKLIDIMKRYNKCILKENAKLRSIYNTLIRECDGAETDGIEANECDAEKAIFGEESKDAEPENECDNAKTMSIEEFLGEADKEGEAGKEKETAECDKCGDDSCKNGEKCGLKENEGEAENEAEKE